MGRGVGKKRRREGVAGGAPEKVPTPGPFSLGKKGNCLDVERACLRWNHGASHCCCCLELDLLGVKHGVSGVHIDH